MARRSPRPEATQEKLLTPLKERCEQCGHPLWVANHSHRTVTTPSGLWKLTLVVRQCIEPTVRAFISGIDRKKKVAVHFQENLSVNHFIS